MEALAGKKGPPESTRAPSVRSEAILAQAGSQAMSAPAGSPFMHPVQDLVADRHLKAPRGPARDPTTRRQRARPQPICTSDSGGEDFYGGCPFQHEADAAADEDEISEGGGESYGGFPAQPALMEDDGVVGGNRPEAEPCVGSPVSPSFGSPIAGSGIHSWRAAGSD